MRLQKVERDEKLGNVKYLEYSRKENTQWNLIISMKIFV